MRKIGNNLNIKLIKIYEGNTYYRYITLFWTINIL